MAVNILMSFRLLIIILGIPAIGLCTGSQQTCTSGFQESNRLVSNVVFRTGPATRLIPEMRFVCNGTIVGYTVAMKRLAQTPLNEAEQLLAMILIWRGSKTQVHTYYEVGAGIPIDEATCIGGLTEVADDMLDCNLSGGARASVESGDILGLQLPPENVGAGVISFARVSKGPLNYVFEQQVLSSPAVLALSDSTSLSRELPQITVRLEVESGHKCTQGFPDYNMLASKLLEDDGHSSTTVTLLIPAMNFTCNGTLAGFTFVGINRQVGRQDPKVQIWRESSPESGIYYKKGSEITVNSSENGACDDGLPTIASRTYLCVLTRRFQVSIQPGDILGLELPPAHDNDFDILFTRGGGPMNYIFYQSLNNSTIHLSENDSTIQQLPQITFSLTSDECVSGFPDTVSPDGSGRGNSIKVTTRLFSDLRFGCSGTIVRIVVAVVNRDGRQSPKIQIWRESEIETGIYYRHGPDIPVLGDSSVCIRHRLSGGLFRCTLNETFQVSVQPGDILGLELPPDNDDDFDIYFKSGGPLNYVFEEQLDCSVNISDAAHQSNDLPQINVIVMLENENQQDERSVVSPLCNKNRHTPASQPALTTTELGAQGSTAAGHGDNPNATHSPVGIIVGTVILGCTLVTASLVFLIIAIAIYKKHHSNNRLLIDLTDKRVVGHEPQCHDYEKIPENTKSHNSGTEQVVKSTELYLVSGVAQPYLEDNDGYLLSEQHLESDEYCQMMMASPARPGDGNIYWEPAGSVNELYSQLCSNKYREIAREQVKIGEKLGSGQFGVVSRGVWESPKGAMDVAVKQLQPGASEEEKVKFLQEAAINGQFRHPNVVMLMGVVTVGEPVMIMLELLSNGDLKSFLMKCRPQIKHCQSVSMEVDEQLLLKFCQHIASGMSYLASKSFVHRDLAARNILVSQDKICKIGDFGMSRNLVDEKYTSHGGMVPVKWMSPEAISYNRYSTASDVWSFGCVMYEIWSLGHGPFANFSNAEVVSAIEKGHRLPPPPGTSKELYKIMIECWQPESAHRPTFPQLVELLSRADFELFAWEEEDLRNSDPHVKTIGAPLEMAKNLYPDLQKSFTTEL